MANFNKFEFLLNLDDSDDTTDQDSDGTEPPHGKTDKRKALQATLRDKVSPEESLFDYEISEEDLKTIQLQDKVRKLLCNERFFDKEFKYYTFLVDFT